MLTKSRVVQLLFMLTVLLVLFFWKTFDVDQKNTPPIDAKQSEGATLLGCDYQQACEFVSEHGSYFLSINNLPIRAEEWIDFELNVPVENSTIAKAQIAGKTMFMGRIPVKFAQSADKQFTAKSMVGACTTDKMVWELQIHVEHGEQSELLSFDFMVVK